MNVKQSLLAALPAILLFSCVSSKKYKQSQADYANLQLKHTQLEGDLGNCNNDKNKLAKEKSELENEKSGRRFPFF